MCDKLVYDLAQEIEGTPSVFVRKDWINILDNQNQNYSSNQSVIDTSQLSNSNKYMGYREGYLLVPLTLTLAQTGASAVGKFFAPSADGKVADSSIGLKNWFGQIIHSMTLDYNGTTIIQQTPFVNMWNSFKLMTSLSYGDIITQGATIGFYPDDPTSFTFVQPVTGVTAPLQYQSGIGVCNNGVSALTGSIIREPTQEFTQYSSGCGNKGLLMRQRYTHYDPVAPKSATGVDYSQLLSSSGATALWKSYVYNKVEGTAGGVKGALQIAVVATIYLKHLHSFFNMCPLLKGAFMKLTLNLNNTTSTVRVIRTATKDSLVVDSVSNAIGGVNPGMVTAGGVNTVTCGIFTSTIDPAELATVSYPSGGQSLFSSVNIPGGTASDALEFKYNISVGQQCLDQSIVSGVAGLQSSPLAKSIYLYVPAYTFNPVFEQAYLSSPVKEIKYTDIYQYQVLDVAGGNQQQFNNLITNGIANIKSILILPYYSATRSGDASPNFGTAASPLSVLVSSTTGLPRGMPVYQSPFDPAGCGATSPLALITNFNVQVSGQNAIYNLQKYAFEQFNHQLYGQNAVNGGLTDGITSGLVDRLGFDMEYCYYYVDLSRMLPVEQSVPKSIQIIGTVASQKAMDLFCFIEYGTSISIDVLSGSRV